MSYQVRFEAFEGPFDLLLNLVSKERVDIYEVPLAKIVRDYFDYLKATELDLEVTSEFVLVAAALLEIKARRLLPREQEEDRESPVGEGREELVARLLAYHSFKGAAEALADRFAEQSPFYARAADLEEQFTALMPDFFEILDPMRLRGLAEQLTSWEPAPIVEAQHVIPAPLILDEYLELVVNKAREAPTTFWNLSSGWDNRERIACFLALLELYRRGEVRVDQDGTFGEIRIALRDEAAIDASEEAHKVN